MKQILLLVFFSVLSLVSFGQKAAYDSQSILFQLENELDAETIVYLLDLESTLEDYKIEPISKSLKAYKLSYTTTFSPDELIELVSRKEGVVLAQRNHLLKNRSVPTDPEYVNQWHLNNTGTNGPPNQTAVAGVDIEAEYLWHFTTGGVTAIGDTLVVCVIDDGVDEDHEDLIGNLFYNHHEIPLNGIDDDQNGYVDDFKGWNTFGDNDSLTNPLTGDYASHGTKVTGVLGAVGNNDLGVSGVNQKIKVMTVIGGGDEADAIKAYEYPLTMRRLYNQTNGAKGAFVVATNTSWGTDFGMPADAPLWCAMYDTLGKEGILNVAATINYGIDVDIEGDLPTTCPSNYLIGVTNISADNSLDNYAGYGLKSIDIAAPGNGIFTTTVNSNYGYDSGTSFSSPQVAGAVALLSSFACEEFAQLLVNDPDSAALLMKGFILNGAVGVPDLYGKSTSQGRLALEQASIWLTNYCIGNTDVAENIEKDEILHIWPNPTRDDLTIQTDQLVEEIKVFNLSGQVVFAQKVHANNVSFSVQNFEKGIYILHVVGSESTAQSRFVKF